MITERRFVTILGWITALALLLTAVPQPAFAEVRPRAQETSGVTVTGAIFDDRNADGFRGLGEPAIEGALVELYDDVNVNGVLDAGDIRLDYTYSDAQGNYRFEAVQPGERIIAVQLPGGAGSAQASLTVVSGEVGGFLVTQNFPLTVTLTGAIFDDRNADGIRGLGEPAIEGALVELYDDANVNGVLDAGDVRLDYTTSDAQGNYRFEAVQPGERIVAVQLPGGAGSAQTSLTVVSGEVGGFLVTQNFPLTVTLTGVIWNDRDGDEIVDPEEARFADVSVLLYRDANANGQVDAGETLAGKTVTDASGQYLFQGLTTGAHLLQVDEGTLPGDYVSSLDPSALVLSLGLSNTAVTINVGYYDPLAVAPLQVADWKKEFKQAGHPYYTPEQLDQLVAKAAAASAVFPEVIGLRNALLLPAKTFAARAQKEGAALRLNLASSRLLPKTPVNLPDLTQAKTVEAATAEVEGILASPTPQTDQAYRRAADIAEALNKGKGLGYGLAGTATLAKATYKGGDVTGKLKAGGDNVDQYADQPIYLLKWQTGKLDAATAVFNPILRLTVKRFENGGILEVMQRLPDGRELNLGAAVPAVWNKDVNQTFTFYLRSVPSVGDMANVELRIYVHDPTGDGGPKEHVRVDAAEVTFAY